MKSRKQQTRRETNRSPGYFCYRWKELASNSFQHKCRHGWQPFLLSKIVPSLSYWDHPRKISPSLFIHFTLSNLENYSINYPSMSKNPLARSVSKSSKRIKSSHGDKHKLDLLIFLTIRLIKIALVELLLIRDWDCFCSWCGQNILGIESVQ